jgi:CrcB protein
VRSLVAVFLGGIVGTAARFSLPLIISRSPEFAATFVFNIVGSFILGLLVGGIWTKPSTPAWLKAGLGTGLLGGFTTFSAVAIDIAQLLPAIGTQSGGWAIGMIVFFFFEIALGLLAAWAGLRWGARSRRPKPATATLQHSVITDDGGDL